VPGLTTGEIGLWGTVDGLSTLNGLSTPPGLLADVSTPPSPGDFLLMEDGSFLLLENGSKILLE
jgi:hypothetical protein